MTAKKVQYEYTTCRSFGHNWAVVDVVNKRSASEMGAELHLICGTCGMLRVDVVSRVSGRLFYRKYNKPENYTTERTSKDEWRRQYLRTAQDQVRRRQGNRNRVRD